MKKACTLVAAVAVIWACVAGPLANAQPAPLLAKGQPVDWFFTYKFNTRSFPQCPEGDQRACPFGGNPINYRSGFGQQYVFASSASPELKSGGGCVGDTEGDPVGATFDQIYDDGLNYVVWNDQFYKDPKITGCGTSCASPWGHSKGVIAWDNQGNGLVLQVTTPSWPAAGNKSHPRQAGNTLGCVANDNNVLVAQSFFAARLSPDDTLIAIKALANSSVVTNPQDLQIFKNGGPAAIRTAVSGLGAKSTSEKMLVNKLSTGLLLISKPSRMHASPWHLVSSLMGSVDLLVATWWNPSDIPDTVASQKFKCWPTDWKQPGAVVNARTGHWDTKSFSLLGVGSASGNHAKIGVATSGAHPYAFFGDLNQEGALSGNCGAKQNGRGGMFFVVENQKLRDSVRQLITNGPPSVNR